MRFAKLQMVVFSILSAAISIGGLAYIFMDPPAYLHATRQGVPYFTPPVINPADGKALDLNMLVRHYQGKDKS
ncbi:MAG TPA: hypothetical protein VMV97_13930 [Sulfuriferula sp.]|nr:hypothetical protein [Sulfuriferula sp.]